MAKRGIEPRLFSRPAYHYWRRNSELTRAESIYARGRLEMKSRVETEERQITGHRAIRRVSTAAGRFIDYSDKGHVPIVSR